MATDSDNEFLDATPTAAMSDVGDMQLTQLQEQLVATMIENENISTYVITLSVLIVTFRKGDGMIN